VIVIMIMIMIYAKAPEIPGIKIKIKSARDLLELSPLDTAADVQQNAQLT
jgi:hypothetical protein